MTRLSEASSLPQAKNSQPRQEVIKSIDRLPASAAFDTFVGVLLNPVENNLNDDISVVQTLWSVVSVAYSTPVLYTDIPSSWLYFLLLLFSPNWGTVPALLSYPIAIYVTM